MDLYSAEIVNPNVAAGTAIDLPGAPALEELVLVAILDTGDYGAAATAAPASKAIVTAAPAAGQAQLSSPSQVTLGDATTDGYQTVLVVGRHLGNRSKPTSFLAADVNV